MNESESIECQYGTHEGCRTGAYACDCSCHWDNPGTVTRAQLDAMRSCFAVLGLEGGAASEQSAFIRSVVGGDWDWMTQVTSLSRTQAGDVLYELSKQLRPSRQTGKARP